MHDYEYYDPKTNLEWKAGPDINMTLDEANVWVISQGDDWRMPTLDELTTLYRKGIGERNMPPELKTTGWWVWSGEKVEDMSLAWGVAFNFGNEYWDYCYNPCDSRGFAVRSRKK